MKLLYRSIFKENYLRPIIVPQEGWAGSQNEFKNKNIVQPFMCKPFLSAATYGYEILYPYKTKLEVKNNGKELEFNTENNWKEDEIHLKKLKGTPVGQIAPNFFGLNIGHDIEVSNSQMLRINTHPSYYTGTTNICALPGHLETAWWSSLLFIVFKAPLPNQSVIFTHNSPIGVFYPLSQQKKFELNRMNKNKANKRARMASGLHSKRENISENYKDAKGNQFDNLYKIISSCKNHMDAQDFEKFMNKISNSLGEVKKCPFALIKKGPPNGDPSENQNNKD